MDFSHDFHMDDIYLIGVPESQTAKIPERISRNPREGFGGISMGNSLKLRWGIRLDFRREIPGRNSKGFQKEMEAIPVKNFKEFQREFEGILEGNSWGLRRGIR